MSDAKPSKAHHHEKAKGVIREARVRRVCLGNVDHPTFCRRIIHAGEHYFAYGAGGIGEFGVCAKCAALSRVGDTP